MKNQYFFCGLLILAIMVSGCTRTRALAENAEPAEAISMTSGSPMENRKLIVYYSLSGNTKFAAEYIQSLTGADIAAIELVEPYSEEYQTTLARARVEQEGGILPELARRIDNLAGYEVIFIGSPNWFGNLSLPVLSFLESHDLDGKTIVPFITFGGGGVQNTVTTLKSRLPNSVFLEEFGVAGSNVENSQSAISQWLERIGMIE